MGSWSSVIVIVMRPGLLFAPETAERPPIPGLHYLARFLDDSMQKRLLAEVDSPSAPWLTDLERRVQHYGWRYGYRGRSITRDMRIGPLPPWLTAIAHRLFETGLFDCVPNQVIVNEYKPGQGIAMHTDLAGFGPTVAMVSLGDSWHMDLRPAGSRARENQSILLEEGSALVLTGEARRDWMHGIAKRKTEPSPAGRVPRRRRVSLTFRTVAAPTTRDSRYRTARSDS